MSSTAERIGLTETQYEQLDTYITGIKVSKGCLGDYVNLDNFDKENPFYSIIDSVEAEITYYSEAMDFLRRYDPSLDDSLELASELCFTAKDLNSEILATLLNEDMIRQEVYEVETEMNEFFAELLGK